MERGPTERRPLLLTDDASVIDVVHRLAAVAGVELRIEPHAGLGTWTTAPVVLVGSDVAGGLVSLHLPRRPGVIVIGFGEPDVVPGAEQAWRDAVAIGAEHVIALPEGEAWLIRWLGDAVEGPSCEGRVTGIASASGGVGASTLAAALAVAAQQGHVRTMLIDGCPDGGGLDLVLGAETVQGIRWPDLADAHGRLSAATLDYALPHPHGVALLSHARPHGSAVGREAANAVLESAVRGYERVFIDLARTESDFTEVALGRLTELVVVVPASIRGIAANLAFVERVRARVAVLHIVVRLLPKGLALRDAAQALAAPDAIAIPHVPAVVERADQGDGSVPADAFGKAVRAVLWSLQPVDASAA